MFRLLIISYVAQLSIAAESVQETSVNYNGDKRIKNNQGVLSFYASLNNNLIPVNRTYFEKDENPLRVPNKFYEEKKKKSKIKKSPKRTIQKIIKNGKSKSRKIYVHPVTKIPTVPSVNEEIIDSYTQRREEIPTERNHVKRYRKNTKVVRYPMPFHKFQSKREKSFRKRNRRDVNTNDIYILNDLDEIEFLSKEKDYNVIKAHVQNHW